MAVVQSSVHHDHLFDLIIQKDTPMPYTHILVKCSLYRKARQDSKLVNTRSRQMFLCRVYYYTEYSIVVVLRFTTTTLAWFIYLFFLSVCVFPSQLPPPFSGETVNSTKKSSTSAQQCCREKELKNNKIREKRNSARNISHGRRTGFIVVPI